MNTFNVAQVSGFGAAHLVAYAGSAQQGNEEDKLKHDLHFFLGGADHQVKTTPSCWCNED